MDQLRDMTLSQLGLDRVRGTRQASVVATVLGPFELDDAARETLSGVLASRVRKGIEELDGQSLGIAEVKFDYSDQALCDDLDGQPRSAFQVVKRCYRIVVYVALT